MMRRKRSGFLSFMLKSFLVILLVLCVFGIVKLRSDFLKLEYSIGELENKKTNALRERKLLLAERTNILSFAKITTTQPSEEGFIIPDRIKVMSIDKNKKYMPYRASLEKRNLNEP